MLELYRFSVMETAPPGSVIGRVKAEDADVGENTDMFYQIQQQEAAAFFSVTTDAVTQEAILSILQVLTYKI